MLICHEILQRVLLLSNKGLYILLSTYNGEKYLKAQLSSILSQLSYDDECLISDDGSTDHTIAIIQEFQNKYPQIRLLQGPRKGVIANFNYCISQSKGDFIRKSNIISFLTDSL